jgi:hypothetical protein
MITDNTDVVIRVMDELKEILQSIAKLTDKVIPVLSYEELMDKSKAAVKPCAGVIYEGMRAIAEPGKDTNRTGTSGEAIFTVLIIAEGQSLNTPQAKASNLRIMGEIRKAMRAKRSPSGHLYRFLLETPEDEKNGTVMWAQRWAVPIPVI